ncbi:unnamed protein product [Paramecium sonneborni]|uniref:Uncharacterized protein n=1 Tax=Paramecium sonneborni TaxID=65129 RepID=A0A8S1MCY5_9CILI|nr:unnamed protein product [Paramecium sonneborni]
MMWIDAIRQRKDGQDIANEYIRHKLRQKMSNNEQV